MMLIEALKRLKEEIKNFLQLDPIIRTSYSYFEYSNKEIPATPFMTLSLFSLEGSPYSNLQKRYVIEDNKMYYFDEVDVVKANFVGNIFAKSFADGYKAMIDIVRLRSHLKELRINTRVLPIDISYPIAQVPRSEIFGLSFNLSIDNILVYNLSVVEIKLILRREFEFEERNSESIEIYQDQT